MFQIKVLVCSRKLNVYEKRTVLVLTFLQNVYKHMICIYISNFRI